MSVSALSTVGASEKVALVTDMSSFAQSEVQSALFVAMLAALEPMDTESLGFSHQALDRLGAFFCGMQADNMDGWVPEQKPLG